MYEILLECSDLLHRNKFGDLMNIHRNFPQFFVFSSLSEEEEYIRHNDIENFNFINDIVENGNIEILEEFSHDIRYNKNKILEIMNADMFEEFINKYPHIIDEIKRDYEIFIDVLEFNSDTPYDNVLEGFNKYYRITHDDNGERYEPDYKLNKMIRIFHKINEIFPDMKISSATLDKIVHIDIREDGYTKGSTYELFNNELIIFAKSITYEKKEE